MEEGSSGITAPPAVFPSGSGFVNSVIWVQDATGGIALFSVLTGFIANLFLSPAGRVRRRRLEPGSTAAQMLEVRRLLDEQDRSTAETRSRLDELERTQVRERAQAR